MGAISGSRRGRLTKRIKNAVQNARNSSLVGRHDKMHEVHDDGEMGHGGDFYKMRECARMRVRVPLGASQCHDGSSISEVCSLLRWDAGSGWGSMTIRAIPIAAALLVCSLRHLMSLREATLYYAKI